MNIKSNTTLNIDTWMLIAKTICNGLENIELKQKLQHEM